MAEFIIKDQGELKYFLGMEVERSHKGIFILQRKYTLDLLKETGNLAANHLVHPWNDIGSTRYQMMIPQ